MVSVCARSPRVTFATATTGSPDVDSAAARGREQAEPHAHRTAIAPTTAAGCRIETLPCRPRRPAPFTELDEERSDVPARGWSAKRSEGEWRRTGWQPIVDRRARLDHRRRRERRDDDGGDGHVGR